MKNRLVVIPSVKDPIKKSPGFAKKDLATYKLDIMGLCGFGCSYCSSNAGNYLRINREKFAALTKEQTGEDLLPATSPDLSFRWGDFEQRLDEQLATRPSGMTEAIVGLLGEGKTLVFSQLTDAFSPWAIADGLTARTLDKVLRRTGFRIRVLTKSAVVGTDKWIEAFKRWPGRFVVGLSIGTLDDAWARSVEVGTSSPTARIKALHALQDAGVPTFGMLCPVFPHAVQRHEVARLVESIRPERCETVWSEPYNDRDNWQAVGAACSPAERAWLQVVFGEGHKEMWSSYARSLYETINGIAACDGWMTKHRYLLYEGDVVAQDAPAFRSIDVLLQGPKDDKGRSKNPHFRPAPVVP